jgi:hypothetical protein
MKRDLLNGKTYLLAIGAGAFISAALAALFLSSDSFHWAGRLLAPGVLLAGALGSGAHDAGIIVWTALGDILLYGILTLVFILLVRRFKPSHKSTLE